MAITVGSLGTKLWQGVAADTKPNATDPRISVNDVFFETDTFKWYLWNGSAWNPTTSAAPGVAPPMGP